MKQEQRDGWIGCQREYMDKQAPLRATWLNEELPADVRAEAKRQLLLLVEETTRKCPPITGTFTYTDEDVKEAREHGF